MDNKGNSVTVLVFALILIMAGIFVAVLTLSGTFENVGFAFLSGFSMYIFGIIIAIILSIVGILLLFFGLHSN